MSISAQRSVTNFQAIEFLVIFLVLKYTFTENDQLKINLIHGKASFPTNFVVDTSWL